MPEKRNLGRGLGDLMQEVADVRAVPAQPAADAGPATDPEPAAEMLDPTVKIEAAQSPLDASRDETPTAVTEPVIFEERMSDEELNSNQPVQIEEKTMNTMTVKEPFLPMWAKAAVGLLALIVAGLVVVFVMTRDELKKAQTDLKNTTVELRLAHDALNADPLAWTAGLARNGVHVERMDKNAKVVFDGPFFASDIRWTPAADQLLRDLLVQIAPHAGECYLTIVGHTATRPLPPGSPYKDNYDLGMRRAQAVVDAMVRIVKWPVTGVSARSNGDKYPPYRGDDVLSQIRNRTITIEIRPR